MKHRFDRFTGRARKVLELAQEEAQRLKHDYIGTEHLLLGLLREDGGIGARSLKNLGLDLFRARSAVESTLDVSGGGRVLPGEMKVTPRFKRTIERAVDEARRLRHDYIGTEHLLLGLVGEESMLKSLGIDEEGVRQEVSRALEGREFKSRVGAPKRLFFLAGVIAVLAGIVLAALWRRIFVHLQR